MSLVSTFLKEGKVSKKLWRLPWLRWWQLGTRGGLRRILKESKEVISLQNDVWYTEGSIVRLRKFSRINTLQVLTLDSPSQSWIRSVLKISDEFTFGFTSYIFKSEKIIKVDLNYRCKGPFLPIDHNRGPGFIGLMNFPWVFSSLCVNSRHQRS